MTVNIINNTFFPLSHSSRKVATNCDVFSSSNTISLYSMINRNGNKSVSSFIAAVHLAPRRRCHDVQIKTICIQFWCTKELLFFFLEPKTTRIVRSINKLYRVLTDVIFNIFNVGLHEQYSLVVFVLNLKSRLYEVIYCVLFYRQRCNIVKYIVFMSCDLYLI